MNTLDTEWERIEKYLVTPTSKRVVKEFIDSRDTYWKERVRKEVEELWHELGKYQGWLGGVMGSEVDSTLMQQPPTKEVREAKALHTAIIMKAKEKVHQTQMKVKSLLDNLK